jgi:hypothetical protein
VNRVSNDDRADATVTGVIAATMMRRSDLMDDARLYSLRKAPDSRFSADLRASLRRSELAAPAARHRPTAKAVTGVLGVAAAAALLMVPAVRASAQSFLALFRVVDFVAVPVGERGLESLESIDLPGLLSEHVQVMGDAPPTSVSSPEEASVVAGYDVRVPAWLPAEATLVEAGVTGARVVRVTADAVRLESVMDTLGITDLVVPPGLHGQQLTVEVPPVVMLRYRHSGRHTRFLQAPAPAVALPAGVELAAVGEIGLRMLGLAPAEARQLAQSIDWTSTLLVPVPPTARSFRPLDVNGHPGMAIQHEPPNQAPTNMILWSDGDRVFALMSLEEMSSVVQIALSVP